jgi:hypothetical protein
MYVVVNGKLAWQNSSDADVDAMTVLFIRRRRISHHKPGWTNSQQSSTMVVH